jgi:hypothetical protein
MMVKVSSMYLLVEGWPITIKIISGKKPLVVKKPDIFKYLPLGLDA